MATSWSSYRTSSNVSRSSPGPAATVGAAGSGTLDLGIGGDDLMGRQLEQARLQRTGFYKRLAEAGSRRENSDGPGGFVEVTSRRRQRRAGSTGGSNGAGSLQGDSFVRSVEEVSTTDKTPAVTLPEPHTSWRYYTSYDNGEWRRHATPVYKSDAEQDLLTKSHPPTARGAAATTGSDMDEGFTGSAIRTAVRARQSALDRHPRLRGSAGLISDLTVDTDSPVMSQTTTKARTVVDEIINDSTRHSPGGVYNYNSLFSMHSPGGSMRQPDVSEMVQKILGDRLITVPVQPATEKVLYANPERQTILDNLPEGAASSPAAEIPEGGDEASFQEKTIAPSGRPWTSEPEFGSSRMIYVAEGFDGTEDGLESMRVHYVDGEELSVQPSETVETTTENWTSRSRRTVPVGDMEAMMLREGGAAGLMDVAKLAMKPPGWIQAPPFQPGRAVLTSESTTREETHTVTQGGGQLPGGTTNHEEIKPRRTGAVEVKVEVVKDGETTPGERVNGDIPHSRRKGSLEDRNTAVEQWLMNSCGTRGKADGVEVHDTSASSRTSRQEWNGLDKQQPAVAPSRDLKQNGADKKQPVDDDVVWIPVIHVPDHDEPDVIGKLNPAWNSPRIPSDAVQIPVHVGPAATQDSRETDRYKSVKVVDVPAARGDQYRSVLITPGTPPDGAGLGKVEIEVTADVERPRHSSTCTVQHTSTMSSRPGASPVEVQPRTDSLQALRDRTSRFGDGGSSNIRVVASSDAVETQHNRGFSSPSSVGAPAQQQLHQSQLVIGLTPTAIASAGDQRRTTAGVAGTSTSGADISRQQQSVRVNISPSETSAFSGRAGDGSVFRSTTQFPVGGLTTVTSGHSQMQQQQQQLQLQQQYKQEFYPAPSRHGPPTAAASDSDLVTECDDWVVEKAVRF